ncbi:hypothetical protein CO057_01915 [Candidatus Uhrbacteria bacterium CG_4_9_14_0_2_um_filter_41_50]|uniref:Transcriptional repressor PaaX-like central Cas2-like domain-containing protein n=1 Tax=Candidatus Uhrbacteria bacterium CG_4_9_14_0_2_um_filter_41_50 TaxID=1975031 RepID=A0A2M8EPF0_9BACT|nr:MAG: hypothetical protein COZ45_04520 [Candidatus Uhrbacteria bacterium CG_4_10_14_3_um_filter_41_21]PIZ54365.1 MAG: hypothetical protein COY24_04055 [Candidatus Uhrbacteria bacterium CG_4_10_14_0_2_um_filter_41_21]PJB84951.1 MAG: hypothetical protein CO086_00915 [Candidatus Uhrbacteria bacterium CG_4_9_14_0_8_um_filter_41_16]PJC24604.1 MAG: hypothetical protein CO057_01915 [Candidatus Uhrbacteria bacterium CG_4_9_14_0_2_um_filter_41_50]PJE74778.1 MAG: hypothetical protein COV03_03750 [Candi
MKTNHLRPKSRGAKLFKELVDDLDLFFTFGNKPRAVLKYGFDGYKKIRDAKEKAYRKQALIQLAAKKFISVKKKSEKYYISLTKIGADEYLRLQLQNLDLLPNGYVCMVVFDIPETERNLRQAIRTLLKEVGFMQTQRSVWISPFDAGELLSKLFQSKTKKSWIKCYTALSHNLRDK